MISLLALIIATTIIIVAICLGKNSEEKPQIVLGSSPSPTITEKSTSKYIYLAKSYLMTPRENEFFKTLNHIFHNKCFVFPQVHLSAILRHEIRGQNWRGAFAHINGKSVDYVLCNRENLKIICVVELDDSTHNRQDRIERDREVEQILKTAQIPIVRFKKPESMTNQEIVNHFAKVLNSNNK